MKCNDTDEGRKPRRSCRTGDTSDTGAGDNDVWCRHPSSADDVSFRHIWSCIAVDLLACGMQCSFTLSHGGSNNFTCDDDMILLARIVVALTFLPHKTIACNMLTCNLILGHASKAIPEFTISTITPSQTYNNYHQICSLRDYYLTLETLVSTYVIELLRQLLTPLTPPPPLLSSAPSPAARAKARRTTYSAARRAVRLFSGAPVWWQSPNSAVGPGHDLT